MSNDQTTVEPYVKSYEQDRIFVIGTSEGLTTLGWDVCLDRIERIAIELMGDEAEAAVTRARGCIGTQLHYDIYRTLQDALKQRYEETGERAVYDLSPQLTGLEGHRVRVQDEEGGEWRRFIVGKSTGWAPCHLEILRVNSSGGGPARLEYHAVEDLGRVR